MKRNDVKPDLFGYLQDINGNAITNLSEATKITFIMTKIGSNVAKVNRTSTLASESLGLVKHTWQAEDTDEVGRFLAEFEVDWGSDERETFPKKNDFFIDVIRDAGDAI